jgi:hypothetical protein
MAIFGIDLAQQKCDHSAQCYCKIAIHDYYLLQTISKIGSYISITIKMVCKMIQIIGIIVTLTLLITSWEVCHIILTHEQKFTMTKFVA